MNLESVSFSRNGKTVLSGIDLKINPGELCGLIGPNGAGKSTLLKLMSKLLNFDKGSIHFEGKPLTDWSHKSLAQRVSYLPQNPILESGFTCFEVVLMGRYARLGRFESVSTQDKSIAHAAMEQTQTAHFAERLFDSLSGGEQQRLLLARALAQEADILLLDEPTASLDLYHQLSLFQLIGGLAKKGRTILLAIHDLNIAARFCDRLILLHQGRIVGDGAPERVLTPKSLQAVYGVRAEVFQHPTFKHLIIHPIDISREQRVSG